MNLNIILGSTRKGIDVDHRAQAITTGNVRTLNGMWHHKKTAITPNTECGWDSNSQPFGYEETLPPSEPLETISILHHDKCHKSQDKTLEEGCLDYGK